MGTFKLLKDVRFDAINLEPRFFFKKSIICGPDTSSLELVDWHPSIWYVTCFHDLIEYKFSSRPTRNTTLRRKLVQ